METSLCDKSDNAEDSKAGQYEYLQHIGMKELSNIDLTPKLNKIKKDELFRLFTKLQTYVRSQSELKQDEQTKLQCTATPALPTGLSDFSQSKNSATNTSEPIVLELIKQVRLSYDQTMTLLKENSEGKLEATRKILGLQGELTACREKLERTAAELLEAKDSAKAAQLQLDEVRLSRPSTSNEPKMDFDAIMNEINLRQEKRRNLVIYGIKESPDSDTGSTALDSNSDTGSDDGKVQKLFTDALGVTGVTLVRLFRLGKPRLPHEKPRPLKLFLESEEVKKKILDKTRKLKDLPDDDEFRRVYIRPDMTLVEREAIQKARNMPSAFDPAGFPPLSGGGRGAPSGFWRGRGQPWRFGSGRARGSGFGRGLGGGFGGEPVRADADAGWTGASSHTASTD